jgi:hypothetical protein
MLEANKNNPKAILESSSIKPTGVNGFVIFPLNCKYIVMASYNASESNQWLLDWFRTQVATTRNKESTIILEMCQVRRGGTFPLMLIVFYLL